MFKLRKTVSEHSDLIDALVTKVNNLQDYVEFLERVNSGELLSVNFETRLKNPLRSSAAISPDYFTVAAGRSTDIDFTSLSCNSHSSSVFSSFLSDVYTVITATHINNETKKVEKNVVIAEFYGQPVTLVNSSFNSTKTVINIEVMFNHEVVNLTKYLNCGLVVASTHDSKAIHVIKQETNKPLQLFAF